MVIYAQEEAEGKELELIGILFASRRKGYMTAYEPCISSYGHSVVVYTMYLRIEPLTGRGMLRGVVGVQRGSPGSPPSCMQAQRRRNASSGVVVSDNGDSLGQWRRKSQPRRWDR